MKKLFLIRHAKSSWENPDLSDFERPLNNRGIQNAPVMAKRFIKNGTPHKFFFVHLQSERNKLRVF